MMKNLADTRIPTRVDRLAALKSSGRLPRLIAICGNPGAGKSTAQSILQAEFGYEPVDDGFPMRDFAMRHLGLSEHQVYTQEGKREFVTIAGRSVQVRDILGTLGNKIEEMFGSWAIPEMALKRCSADGRYTFGSVRRDQGAFFKANGGIVIEIRIPLAGPSPFEFDRYDAALADHVVENDAYAPGRQVVEARDDLKRKLERVLLEHDRRS